jgi:hypothetical protein
MAAVNPCGRQSCAIGRRVIVEQALRHVQDVYFFYA